MCQIKAPIAGNSQSIAKIGNAELAHFTKQMLIHELIRGSLILLTRAPADVISRKNTPVGLVHRSRHLNHISLIVIITSAFAANLNSPKELKDDDQNYIA
jgi:hypothetical protein